jgi:uncharacterized protein (DUF952 family)
MRLFHLVPTPDWHTFLASDEPEWKPASLATEGFIHLSFAEQLPGTLAAHFGAHTSVVLLEVAVADAQELVIEASRSGADFPHLYRSLTKAECMGHWPLEACEGAWTVPTLGVTPTEDVPQRVPGVANMY